MFCGEKSIALLDAVAQAAVGLACGAVPQAAVDGNRVWEVAFVCLASGSVQATDPSVGVAARASLQLQPS